MVSMPDSYGRNFCFLDQKCLFRIAFLYVVIVCNQENTKILFFLLSITMSLDELMLMLHVTVKSASIWIVIQRCLEET
jgi:hypothetical protein